MADITDERLREIATSDPLVLAISAQMGEPSWADVRAIAAELLAARARIAKLEQEPPMALVDFGVGVNWKGLHEDMQRLRAERDAARAEVAAAREHMGVVQSALDAAHLEEVEDELGGLRAEIRRLDGVIDDIEERAWRALGEPEGTHETTNVQRLCAEVERLRADLREAMELLRAHGQPPDWLKLGEAADWNTRYGKLLEKHKETP